MIKFMMKRKKYIFLLFFSYIFLIVGGIPSIISMTQNSVMPMMAGYLTYIITCYTALIVLVWTYAKENTGLSCPPGTSLSVVLLILSMLIVFCLGTIVYGVSEMALGLGENKLVNYKRLLHMVAYRFSHDLITLLLSMILAFILSFPIRIYKKDARISSPPES